MANMYGLKSGVSNIQPACQNQTTGGPIPPVGLENAITAIFGSILYPEGRPDDLFNDHLNEILKCLTLRHLGRLKGSLEKSLKK